MTRSRSRRPPPHREAQRQPGRHGPGHRRARQPDIGDPVDSPGATSARRVAAVPASPPHEHPHAGQRPARGLRSPTPIARTRLLRRLLPARQLHGREQHPHAHRVGRPSRVQRGGSTRRHDERPVHATGRPLSRQSAPRCLGPGPLSPVPGARPTTAAHGVCGRVHEYLAGPRGRPTIATSAGLDPGLARRDSRDIPRVINTCSELPTNPFEQVGWSCGGSGTALYIYDADQSLDACANAGPVTATLSGPHGVIPTQLVAGAGPCSFILITGRPLPTHSRFELDASDGQSSLRRSFYTK